MKRTRVVAALALAFALGISIAFVNCNSEPEVSASSEVTLNSDSANAANEVIINSQDDLALLRTSANSPDITKITLNSDLVLGLTSAGKKGDIKITRPSDAAPLEINLNGHTIRSEGDTTVTYTLQVKSGHVHLTGNGVVKGRSAVAIYGAKEESATNFSSLTVDSGVELVGTVMYGVAVMDLKAGSGSYGTTLNLNNPISAPYGISVIGTIKHTNNAPQIHLGDQTVINATGNPIYAAGYANWTIGQAHITSEAGIGIKAGTMVLNGTTVTATGEAKTPDSQTGSIDESGSAIQIEHHPSYADQISITINGGTYQSEQTDVFYEYGLTENPGHPELAQADIDINGGTFIAGGPDGKIFGGTSDENNIQITSGKFTGQDVSSFAEKGYLAEGVEIDENGVVAVPKIEPVYPRPSYSPAISGTYQSADGIITVSGKFSATVADVRVKHLDKFMSIFNGSDYALYDIELLDAAGKPVEARGEITVSIAVPTKWSDREISVFYVGENNNLEKHTAAYADGKVTFTTTHFSVYAVVSDGGKTVPDSIYQPGRLDNTDAEPSEGNQNNNTNNNDNNVSTPETGTNHHTSAGDAVVTALPLLTAAGLIFIVFSRKIFKRQAHNYRTADVEQEIDTQIKEFVAPEPEEDNERFLATPMTQMDAEEIRTSVLKSSQK